MNTPAEMEHTAKLIRQVQAKVGESGRPENFDAAQWVAAWLDKPLIALGGQTPAEGREVVSRLLATAQTGAYV